MLCVIAFVLDHPAWGAVRRNREWPQNITQSLTEIKHRSAKASACLVKHMISPRITITFIHTLRLASYPGPSVYWRAWYEARTRFAIAWFCASTLQQFSGWLTVEFQIQSTHALDYSTILQDYPSFSNIPWHLLIKKPSNLIHAYTDWDGQPTWKLL